MRHLRSTAVGVQMYTTGHHVCYAVSFRDLLTCKEWKSLLEREERRLALGLMVHEGFLPNNDVAAMIVSYI